MKTEQIYSYLDNESVKTEILNFFNYAIQPHILIAIRKAIINKNPNSSAYLIKDFNGKISIQTYRKYESLDNKNIKIVYYLVYDLTKKVQKSVFTDYINKIDNSFIKKDIQQLTSYYKQV